MKDAFLIFSCCLFFFACEKRSNEYYLYNGLEKYDKSRFINEEFITGYGIKKIAFFREADQLQYVLMLTDEVSPQMIEKYSLGLHIYLNKNNMWENQGFLVWDTKPQLQNIGNNHYIINGFKSPIKKMDSMVFFLYDRARYNGVIGNRIVVKNIGL